MRALADKEVTGELQHRRAMTKADLPFEHDLSEFHELILLLEDRKHEALRKERLLMGSNYSMLWLI